MNLTLRNKKMSFEKFVDTFGEHFKAMKNPTQEMQKIYERETGKSVNTKTKRKQAEKL